jgi:hypothetical protein
MNNIVLWIVGTAEVVPELILYVCFLQDRVEMIDKAQSYLESHLEEKQRPLTAAITAYALALAGSEWSREFNMKLMDQSITMPQGRAPCVLFLFVDACMSDTHTILFKLFKILTLHKTSA